jgi:TPR repeat protein
MYAEGLGVPKNRAQALDWYRRAADKGSTIAAENVKNLENPPPASRAQGGGGGGGGNSSAAAACGVSGGIWDGVLCTRGGANIHPFSGDTY